MSKLRSAILCGGSGTRLWPLSRDHAPKQFHSLVGEMSLLSSTVQRALSIPGSGSPLILTAEPFAGIARKHAAAGGAGDVEILLEPSPRNTAPAAALAALAAAGEDPATIVALLPSDHHIAKPEAFLKAIDEARALAAEGAIVTLGIVPDAPHTGYGYIRRGAPVGGGYKVDRFVEKPNAQNAQRFFDEGGYYWNAGIFVFRADVFLEELERFAPKILAATRRAWELSVRKDGDVYLDSVAWSECPSDSIDYAVAEKTDRAAVVPAEFGWNDVGSWSSLMDLAYRDSAGNAVYGDAAALGSAGCYIRSTSRHVSVIGASDLIVVETDDAVLIVHKDATQDVKGAAEAFKRSRQRAAQ